MLADFGPLFELGCGESMAHNSSSGGGSSSSGRDAGASSDPAGPHPPQFPEVWQGRPLQLRVGGPPGQQYWSLEMLAVVADEEDDPYEDEEEDEEEGEENAGRGSGGRGSSRGEEHGEGESSGEDDDDPYEDEEQGDEEGQGVGLAAGSPGSSGSGGSISDTEWSPPMSVCLVEAPVVAAQPLEACSQLLNAVALNGSIAVLRRGR